MVLARVAVNSAGLEAEISFSSNTTFPLVGVNKAPMMDSRVLFPEPDGPTIATNSPSLTFNEISFKTLMDRSPSGKDFDICCNCRTSLDNFYSLLPIASNGSIFVTLYKERNDPAKFKMMNKAPVPSTKDRDA